MDKSASQKIDNFFSGVKVINYKKGDIVIRAEDEPQGIYYVKSGYVKMNSLLEDGRELTVNIFKKGSYFPMMWAIGNVVNTYFYQALSDVCLQRVSKEKLIAFLNKNPDVVFELCRRVLIGLNALITNIEYIISGNAHDRVISALILLTKRFGEKIENNNNRIIIKLPLTHQDIANISAITRETASIIIKKIERKKIISRQRKFLVIESLSDLKKESHLQKEELDLPLAA